MEATVLRQEEVGKGGSEKVVVVEAGWTAQELIEHVAMDEKVVRGAVFSVSSEILGEDEVLTEERGPYRVVVGSGVVELPKADGYRGFGSFFNEESVEEMIQKPASEWRDPIVCSEVREVMEKWEEAAIPSFGEEMKKWFEIERDWTFINHGAFGGALLPASEVAAAWRARCEAQPLRFFDRELFPHLVASLRCAGDLIGASTPTDLAFVPNATTGLNVAVNAAQLREGDNAFCFNLEYGGLKKILQAACDDVGATLLIAGVSILSVGGGSGEEGGGEEGGGVELTETLVEAMRREMPHGCALMVVDSVTSNTALEIDVEVIARVAKEEFGCKQVLVDGAHALGQCDVSWDRLKEAGVDWFVTNAHKWFSSPRGLAILCASPTVQPQTRPLTRSHGIRDGFTSSFVWDGCRDYAPILTFPFLASMWKKISSPRLHTPTYTTELLKEAVTLLETSWGWTKAGHTPLLTQISHAPMMALVQLPKSLTPLLLSHIPSSPTPTSTHAKFVQDTLFTRYKVECPVKCIEDVLFVRISVQIYNSINDYRHLAHAILSIIVDLQTTTSTPSD